MIPIVISVSTLEPTGGVELLLVDAYQIPTFFAETTAQGNTTMSIPDDSTDELSAMSDGLITSGTAETLHDFRTDANYTVATTGTLRLVVQVISAAANIQFKVWKSTSVDSATGTTVYDFTDSTNLDSGQTFTTPILDFSVTAADFINVEAIGGNISFARAWIVEKP